VVGLEMGGGVGDESLGLGGFVKKGGV